MTDQNLSILEQDINVLLREEYGSRYRIITYEPRPNIAGGGLFGITLTVEVTQNGISRRAHARKENNLDLINEVKNQIEATQAIPEKHYIMEQCILDPVQRYAYEGICKELGIDVDFFEDLPKHEAAYKMLCNIAKVFNGDGCASKYYIPKFDFEVTGDEMTSSAARSNDFYYDFKIVFWPYKGQSDISVSGPVSIAYISHELARKSGDLFPELWYNFLTGQK